MISTSSALIASVRKKTPNAQKFHPSSSRARLFHQHQTNTRKLDFLQILSKCRSPKRLSRRRRAFQTHILQIAFLNLRMPFKDLLAAPCALSRPRLNEQPPALKLPNPPCLARHINRLLRELHLPPPQASHKGQVPNLQHLYPQSAISRLLLERVELRLSKFLSPNKDHPRFSQYFQRTTALGLRSTAHLHPM